MVNDNYIRKVVRNMGVPELWADDALQDVRLRMWLAQDDRKIIVIHAAIDAARRYGGRTRHGVVRLDVPFEAVVDHPLTNDACTVVNDMLDTARGLKRLVPRHLALIQRRITDGPVSAEEWTNVDHMGLSNARKRLRELVK